MSNMTLSSSRVLLFLAAILLIGGSCNTSKKLASAHGGHVEQKMLDPYAGHWDYFITDTPMGDMNGVMTIEKEKGTYLASMTGAAGRINLDNVQIEENQLTGTFIFQGYEVELAGAIESDNFTGELTVDYESFPITATRRNP